MAKPLVVDTDILIDYARRRPEAVAFMKGLGEVPLLSVVTVAELYAGVREGEERRELDDFVSNSSLIDINAAIAVRAGLFCRQYHKSHGVGLADALIAASVESRGASFKTLNEKHFPMLADVVVPYRKA